ncbi:serine kinase [Nostoc sp. UHCC 0302]|uniref:serine kinase n=1 Tax=Nostoc sp. UHCC 0302 TaxID=3134896 RepID=UPI00311CAD4D
MYNHTAYGLGICSALPLPELQSSTHIEADVVIRFGEINWSLPTPPPSWSYFEIDGEDAYLYWKVVGKFLVRSGKEIIIEPLPDVEESVIRLPLLGAVLGMLLHQRQFLVLHGSAVAVDGNAAVFLGRSGQGKSTMAATLYGRGHKLMADDVAAVDVNNASSPILVPGFPRIKLWPDAASAALGDDPETLRKIHPEVEKRDRPTFDNFLRTPLTLKRIYILSVGSTLQIKPLQPPAAVTQLIANSYIPMLIGQKFIRSANASVHLHQCTRLINNLPIYSLERPRSLELLPDVAHLVEKDLADKIQPAIA